MFEAQMMNRHVTRFMIDLISAFAFVWFLHITFIAYFATARTTICEHGHCSKIGTNHSLD